MTALGGNLIHRFRALSTLSVLALACLIGGIAQAETIGFSLSVSHSPGGQINVVVKDDATLAPIPDATVSVSSSLAKLEEGRFNFALTPKSGSVRLHRDTGEQVVTVSKSGYATISILGVQSDQVTVFLKSNAPVPQVVASGILKGWVSPSGYSSAFGGVVVRTLSALDLLSFDFKSLISPLKDTIDVFGKRQIPSNIVLPQQDVFLPIGSITLNKPTYRLPVQQARPVRLVGVHAEVRVSDVISAFQPGGKYSVDLLNKLKFTRVGIGPQVTPQSDFQQDINASYALSPTYEVTVTPPPFNAHVFVGALTELDSERLSLLPTDFKTAINGDRPGDVRTMTLVSPRVGRTDVVSIAVGDKGARVSGILTAEPSSVVRPGQFMDVPAIQAFRQLPDSIAFQSVSQGIGVATFLSKDASTQHSSVAWVVNVLPTAGTVSIPTHLIPSGTTISSYSLSQFEFAPSFDPRQIDGRSIMKSLQRFSRASAKQVEN
jgi:hypothetical protein